MGKVGKLIAGIVLIAGGAVVGFATGNWQIAKILITSGASMALSTMNRPTGLADRQGAILENHASAQDPLPVVYGTARIGNILGDVRVHLGSTERKRLVIVSAFCHGSRDGGDIAGIDDVWFDDRKAINAAGVVQAPFNTLVPNQGGIRHLEFAHHLGSTGQAVDARLTALFPTFWPAAAQGRAVAYTRFELWFNNDIFASGIPRITAQIRGNRVFDPRDATWKFSDNPALCGRDFLLSPIYGYAVPAANIDEQSVIDGANYCDELVSIPGGGTQKRFTLNGWVDTGRTIQQNLADLGTACRGQWVNEGDKWRLVIRRQQALSGFKISEKNTVQGSWSFILPGTADAPNVMRVHYVDPLRDAQPELVQWPEPGAANPYLVEDNAYESRVDVELPYTDNRLRAQQIGMTLLKEGREGIAVICTLMESALAIRIGEIVEVSQPTPGWVDKPFWVVALLLAPDATVQAVLIEYEPTVYDYDAQVVQPVYPNTGLPDPFTCAPPTVLVLDSSNAQALLLKDGTYVGRIKATWTKADDAFVDHYDVQAKRNTDVDWDTFEPVRGEEPALIFVYPVTEELWNVRVSAVNQLGIRSTWLSGNATVTVPNPTVEDADILILPTGQVNVVVRTRNAGSVKVAAKVDGTDPTDVEIRAAGAVNTGVDGVATVNAVGTVAPNGTVKIGVFAYENVAAGGRESAPSFHKTRVWDQVPGALINAHQVLTAGKRVGIAIEAVGYLSVKWALAVGGPYGAPGTGTTVNLDADFTALIDTAQVLTFLQQAYITITPYTGAGATGTQGGAIHLRARPIIEDGQYDETTGKRRRAGVLDDGLFILKASDAAGNTANSTVTESGGKAVNRILAKALAADPDTYDGVPAGTYIQSTGLKYAALVGSERAHSVSKRHGIFFSEVFEETPATQGWASSGSATETLVGTASLSTVGQNVLQAAGYMWRVFPQNMPFNPTKLYRLRCRLRQTVDGAPNNVVYIGLQCFLADNTPANNNGGYNYVCVGGYAATVAGGWVQFTGWLKGAVRAYAAGSTGPSTDPRTPADLNVDTVWVRPLIAVNYAGGIGTTQVDYFQIDELDEDAAQRIYEVVQSDKATLYATVKESGGKAANRLYAKTLAADPDTADSVAVGLVRDVVKLTALTSGEVDFSKAGVLNRIAANLLRAGGGATIQAIVAQLSDAGHAASGMQESGGKAINRLLAKALAADSDNADSVGDGSSKRVTSLNEATGAGRAFDVIDTANEVGRVAPSTGDLVVNGEFERGVANWRVTSGGDMESVTPGISGAKSLRITAVNSTTHRVQQCDRTTDVNDSAVGNPLYTPVNNEDEAYVEARVSSSLATSQLTYTIGIEEYNASKTLVQRTPLATITGDNVLGAILIRGGAGLQATTRFIVPYLELVVGAFGGGVTTNWDTFRCFVLPIHEHCKVYRSGALNLANNAAAAIQWDAEDHDVGSAAGMHSLSVSLSQVRVQQGGYGKVHIVGQVQFAAGATGYRLVQIKKNGATILAETAVMAVTTAAIPTTVQVRITDRRPATGDFYEIVATQTNGGLLAINTGVGATFCLAIHEPY